MSGSCHEVTCNNGWRERSFGSLVREVRGLSGVTWGVSASDDSILWAYRFVAFLCEPLKDNSYKSESAEASPHSLISVYIHLCAY